MSRAQKNYRLVFICKKGVRLACFNHPHDVLRDWLTPSELEID